MEDMSRLIEFAFVKNSGRRAFAPVTNMAAHIFPQGLITRNTNEAISFANKIMKSLIGKNNLEILANDNQSILNTVNNFLQIVSLLAKLQNGIADSLAHLISRSRQNRELVAPAVFNGAVNFFRANRKDLAHQSFDA